MSHYTFTFKKDDVVAKFTTTDKELVERQFQIWVTCADVYTYNKEHLHTEPLPKVEDPKAPLPQLIQPQVQVEEEKLAEKVEEIVEEKVEEQPAEVVAEIVEEQKPEQQVATINQMVEIQSVQEEIEKNIENQQKSQENTQENTDFDAILANSMEKQDFEPVKVKDERFVKIVTSKNVTENIDYLLTTALYLSQFEKLEKFSLKQINAKLMQNFEKLVDHEAVQEALNRGFLEVLPDLTGVSGVCEYRLTSVGEEAASTNQIF